MKEILPKEAVVVVLVPRESVAWFSFGYTLKKISTKIVNPINGSINHSKHEILFQHVFILPRDNLRFVSSWPSALCSILLPIVFPNAILRLL